MGRLCAVLGLLLLASCQALLSFGDAPSASAAAADAAADANDGLVAGEAGSPDAGPADASVVWDGATLPCNNNPPFPCRVTETCCYVTLAGQENQCKPRPQECPNGSFPITCRSVDDCKAGDVCCGVAEGAYYQKLACLPPGQCAAPNKVVCRTSLDCLDGGGCTGFASPPLFGLCK